MPSLVVSSRYTTDSQLLRQTAQELGWETLRLDGRRIPDWFDPPDQRIALFYTAPHAFEIAAQLSRTLLGCNPEWTVQLPREFLLRELRQMTLGEALQLPGESFIKHSVSKAFPAAVYNSRTLAEATAKILPKALVHVGEPVAWTVEYRCFVSERVVMTISPYRRHGEISEDHANLLGAPQAEIATAKHFAESVLGSSAVDCPPAFVLDVGIIDGRGWAVVEFNEAWASGIYACDPRCVLETLLRACVPSNRLTVEERRWDFRRHYFDACP
jgi:hypothetical protein